jgi:prolyl-tRNA synthetase
LKGIPLRLEIGPNEAENGEVTAVRRDNGEKEVIDLGNVSARVPELLDEIQASMFSELEEYLDENIRKAPPKEESIPIINEHRGYVKALWCGNESCEDQVKDETAAEIVVLPFREDAEPATARTAKPEGECAVCGSSAETWVYYAKNY